MGYIGDQIGFQPFALNALFQRPVQSLSDRIDVFRNILLFFRKPCDIDLIVHLPAGNLLNPFLDLMLPDSIPDQIYEYQYFRQHHQSEEKDISIAEERHPVEEYYDSKYQNPFPHNVHVPEYCLQEMPQTADQTVLPQNFRLDPAYQT